jgi:protein-tyrosine-phosphatase
MPPEVHLDDFQGQSFDYIITVCDKVRENCPVFPGDPDQIHWSLPDPVAVQGRDEERYQAFIEIARTLTTRLNYLLIRIEREAEVNSQ